MSNKFDWQSAEEEGNVVVQSVQAIAIYENPRGEIVIRQEAGWNDSDDAYIIVPKPYVRALISKLTDALNTTTTEKGDQEFVLDE